jgi:hypothetical protein
VVRPRQGPSLLDFIGNASAVARPLPPKKLRAQGVHIYTKKVFMAVFFGRRRAKQNVKMAVSRHKTEGRLENRTVVG